MNAHIRPDVLSIIGEARTYGWVMEPLAKKLLAAYHLPVTRFVWARTIEEARAGAQQVSYPLVAKVVSPEIIHKSDAGGIVVGVQDDTQLDMVFEKMSTLPGFVGVLLDQMVSGYEVIVGSKVDPQFGTVILVGIGGTAVEIYKDVAIRMAPVDSSDALDALHSLTGSPLLTGHRNSEPANLEKLAHLIHTFSTTALELEPVIESIDLNPVLCSSHAAIIADARVMLK